jgi:hypothetical protein
MIRLPCQCTSLPDSLLRCSLNNLTQRRIDFGLITVRAALLLFEPFDQISVKPQRDLLFKGAIEFTARPSGKVGHFGHVRQVNGVIRYRGKGFRRSQDYGRQSLRFRNNQRHIFSFRWRRRGGRWDPWQGAIFHDCVHIEQGLMHNPPHHPPAIIIRLRIGFTQQRRTLRDKRRSFRRNTMFFKLACAFLGPKSLRSLQLQI